MATIEIKGIGEYKGIAKTTFKISNPPARVKNLSVKKSTSNSITITWNKSAEATYYKVYINDTDVEGYELVKKVTTTELNITKFKKANLKPGKTYYIKIKAYNNDGISRTAAKFTVSTKEK